MTSLNIYVLFHHHPRMNWYRFHSSNLQRHPHILLLLCKNKKKYFLFNYTYICVCVRM